MPKAFNKAASKSWMDSLITSQATYKPTKSKDERKAARATKAVAKAERTGKKLPTPKQKKEKTLPSAPSNGGANKSAANAAPATSKRPKSHSHNASFLSSLSDTLAAAKEISSETPKHLIPPMEEMLPEKPHNQVKMNDDVPLLQPRHKDYNGQGLARPSIYMDICAPDFVPRFNQQFEQHVEGFFGKVKTKAMKKQKKREEAANGEGGETTALQDAMKSKSLEGLTADERVERLLAAGLL